MMESEDRANRNANVAVQSMKSEVTDEVESRV